ncbi:carotenoid biosynthesis protein [Nocardia wallacei]|uniref:carotenoid biosynthesis protein n=1 Tax=Nocardia wallacei TaxID=480035 RepID=UPI002458D17B|nr:carotenoid biosynthesis protein [Nocardia wallacei]
MTVRRLPALTAIALVLAQIAYPLTIGAARDRVTVVVVLLSVVTALAHARVTRGPRFAAGFLLIVSGIGLAAEIAGTTSGFPFGCYHYAHDRLGPAVADVPLLIALAWTGGLYPVWVVANRLGSVAAVRVPLTAAGAVGWDLFLDPQMVADGQWTWCSPHPGLPSWNAHRRRCTRVPGMVNNSMNPSPRVQKSTDAARSPVGIFTNAGIP